jgi:ABC-type transporter Mla subunit MlaD
MLVAHFPEIAPFRRKCTMPTERPRFTITTSPQVYETITHLAKLQNCSRSSVINELLESIHDPLRRTIVLLEAAQAAPRQLREGLRATIDQLENDVTGDLGKSSAQLELVIKKLQKQSREAEK